MKHPEISTRYIHVAREKGSMIDRYFVVGHDPLIFIDLDNGKTLYEKDFNGFFNSVGFYDDVYPHKKNKGKWRNAITRTALVFKFLAICPFVLIEICLSVVRWIVSGKWHCFFMDEIEKVFDKIDKLNETP